MPAYGNTTNPNGAQTASRSPMAMPSLPGLSSSSISHPATPYAGGDVAGLASYYRNSARQQYQTPMSDRTDAAIGFLRANPSVPLTSQIAGLTAGSMPAAAMNAATASAVNQYANPVMGLSPDQKLQIAQQSAARTMGGGPVADPTGLGSRMAGISANPIPWYDRVKQGQQAQEASRANQLSQEYLAGIPANAAMNRTYTGPFSKQTPFGLAYTNRTGALEQMAAANPNSRNIQDALDTENLAGQIRADLTADRLQKYKDSHDGLSARQFRRKKETELRIERQLKTGKINKEEAAIQKQMAGISPKSPAQSGNVDRVRLPNGQLPDATREKAATTAMNLTDPNYTGPSPEFQKQSEIVRSIGLTTDMNANSAANAIRNTPIPDDPRAQKEFVAALRKYWGSMKDSDAEWASAGDSEEAAALNQLSELPDSKVDEWMKTWFGIINRRQAQQNEQDKIRNSPSPYGGDFYQF